MIEVQILIPLVGNDSVAFTPKQHADFESVLLSHFGGCSKLPGNVTGQWVGEGKTYTDSLVVYVVAMPSILDAAKLGAAVAFARTHYAQEAIYIRYLGLSEVL